MPPKKKKGKGKGKGKKKKKDDAGLDLDDKYKKTMSEIKLLKDQLVQRKEIARRSEASEGVMRSRMNETVKELETKEEDFKDMNADMARHFKTTQTKMGLRIHNLEMELVQTQNKLKETEKLLRETQDEKERIIRDKDQEIDELNVSIRIMEKDYVRILDEALNSLVGKIDNAKSKWETASSNLQARNKQNLLELGLHPLEI